MSCETNVQDIDTFVFRDGLIRVQIVRCSAAYRLNTPGALPRHEARRESS
jgi:hypothetical protein